jgi:Holliday junction resolvase RusA-like endonuclease
MLLNLDTVVDNLIKAISDVQIRLQIIDVDQRIHELELRQEGTQIIESLLGYQIGD